MLAANKFFKAKEDRMYQLPTLSKVPSLVHGFSTMEEGNQGFRSMPAISSTPGLFRKFLGMVADWFRRTNSASRNQAESLHALHGARKYEVLLHRTAFLRKVSSDFRIACGVGMVPLKKGYEGTIAAVSPAQAGRGMLAPNSGIPCEALITSYKAAEEHWRREEHIMPTLFYLFLAIADCLPIILYDPVERVLALVHAGRESSVRKIALETVRIMERHYGVDPATVIAGIGPGIRKYKLDRFHQVNDSEWQPFCRIGSNGKIEVDLFGFNVHLLKRAGIPEDQIEVWPGDTFTDLSFYSHTRSRLGAPEGRHAIVVGMVPVE